MGGKGTVFGGVIARNGNAMAKLDGVWLVERTGGWLPPLVGVQKHIEGSRGVTRLWRFPGVRFDVDGLALRYRVPLCGLVDLLDPYGDGFHGRATFRGRELGRFRMKRQAKPDQHHST